MCGIVGFNSKNSAKIDAMLDSIKHRGPDGVGKFESDLFSMGHVRLSILDLSKNGDQPMYFENIVMVYNGEIYNFKEIRKELINYGYHFVSNTDSEVVLKAYHKWGIKAINKFIGMFAIAFYDKSNQILTIIRDRTGIKPLYYFFNGDDFIFASELRPIMKFQNNLDISNDALSEFFRYGYISSNLSIFKDCYKLPAGYFGVFDLNQKSFKLEQYWSVLPFFDMPKFDVSEEKLIDNLEEVLVNAFTCTTVSDVPIGIFLSGGIDSSIVTAILQKHCGNVNTFTIGFNNEKYNEAEYAKNIARFLKTNHHEEYLDISQAKSILKKFPDIYDEPFADSSGIPTVLVSEFAKKNGIKVVLSADGGDEIFCGYERYWNIHKIGKEMFKVPKILRKYISRTMTFSKGYVLPLLSLSENLRHKYYQLKEILNCNEWLNFYELMVQSNKNYEIEELFKKRTFIEKSIISLNSSNEHAMQDMMLWDFNRYMPDDILTKVDRATMSVGIEGREPMLDHRIIEFMARVPFELKYKNKTSKYILRKVLERYVPSEMFSRPKMGFGIPMLEWFSGDLSYLFNEFLRKDRIQHNLLNECCIANELKKLKNGKQRNINKLWFILAFQMWYFKYIK
ncbi:asparagine synthase (glutamine-hydrolyzing) [Campylobacter concisus]|uniref:asparagine synthase (glutamine-hydrolyzing) n=1 Tax=Campylobacter concisus TaxID=199 RepID=UPI000D31A785|nr:asparagine synthase (glutamine-hydrolyzing) [Campylobacter concisus]